MSEVARAREMSETQGFMKIMVDAHTWRILGAQMIGTRCDEVIHCVLYVMYTGAPHAAISRSMPIHPNVAELLPTMLKQLEPLE
jgi:pyruvate/2-oxoglutarate dehydrogenase complex dihydrolipoamide dehydrogenase (E3) component